MKIKNKARLVARAEAHRRADHFIQGQYLTQLSKPFKGCEIGCLATPVRVSAERRRRMNGMFGDELCGLIGREFGVCEKLLRVAEDHFEDAPNLTTASNFVVAFAKALPEGVDVSDGDVKEWYLHGPGTKNPKRQFLDWLRRGCPAPRKAAVR